MCATNLGLGQREIKLGSAGHAVPGYNIRVMDDQGKELPPNSQGQIVVKLPLPPGIALDACSVSAGRV